jgi:plasmid maintenance system antidote protein VapI
VSTSVPWDPDWVCCPGETLQEWMDDMHVSPKVLAVAAGRWDEASVAALLAGDLPLTHDIAARLAAATGITPRIWLRFEAQYRAGLAAGRHHEAHP